MLHIERETIAVRRDDLENLIALADTGRIEGNVVQKAVTLAGMMERFKAALEMAPAPVSMDEAAA